MAYATGAMALLKAMTAGALRQTKRLSPYKSTVVKKGKGKGAQTSFTGSKNKYTKTIDTKKELTMIGSGINKGLKSVGVSATNRGKALERYQKGYRHLRKNKKLYGAAVAGGVTFDIFDDD